MKTRTAIACVLVLTLDRDRGPEWMQAIIAVAAMLSTIYLLWYAWFGPEPVERKRVKR